MACLEMRKDSKWWYGRWGARGRTLVKNLNIAIEGRHPESINLEGDRRFEQSRMRAQAKLEELARAATDRRRASDLIGVYHQIQTGNAIATLPLLSLPKAWSELPRDPPLPASEERRARKIFERFLAFLHAYHPDVTELAGVTHAMANAFMKAEEHRHVAGRSFNRVCSLLRGAYKHLRRQAGLVENPFDEIKCHDEHTMHRIPFTAQELEALLGVAQEDAFCRPLIVTGACTALRLGDVCLLHWRDVDLGKQLIAVRTAKTDARISIPIFPPLYAELSTRPRDGEFCFPEQAAMYRTNPSGVNYRLQKFFEAAGYADDGAQRPVKLPPADEIRRCWAERFPGCADRYSLKVRAVLPRVLDRYLAGKVTREIMADLGISKGGVSVYLKRIEAVLGFPVVRTSREPVVVKVAVLGKHKQGSRRVNQRGFHALRATWVTLALLKGVPIEVVRSVTGHAITETVIENYFNPKQEEVRQVLQAAMPKMLTSGGEPSRDEQMLSILTQTSAKTWACDSKRLIELLNLK
jgi:integrase